MTEERYWGLLEIAWRKARNSSPYQMLKTQLETEPINELLSFHEHFNGFRKSAATAIQLAAAFVLYEGVLDDEDFLEYLEGLVAVPKNVFEGVKRNPDGILDHLEYCDLVGRDGYPFATLAVSVGEKRFGADWRNAYETYSQSHLIKDSFSIQEVFHGNECGYDIVTPDFCKRNIPRIFDKYGGCCNW